MCGQGVPEARRDSPPTIRVVEDVMLMQTDHFKATNALQAWVYGAYAGEKCDLVPSLRESFRTSEADAARSPIDVSEVIYEKNSHAGWSVTPEQAVYPAAAPGPCICR